MKRTLLMAISALFLTLPIFAQMSYSVTTDFAYKPASDFVANAEKTHFAPITGAYGGIEGRVTGAIDYTIATPLGDHWLLSSANLKLTGNLELTPVTLKPGVEATWTPLPFVVLSTGGQIGTGWDIGDIFKSGVAIFDEKSGTYTSKAFTAYLLKYFAQLTIQFDTGALIPGDWTHLVMLYSYQAYYEGLTGAKNGDIWMWQLGGNCTNGWSNYQQAILAYQMPLVLYRAGIMWEFNGHYSASDYGKYADSYSGKFKSMDLSPLFQFKFGEKDTLSVLINFSSRRTYKDYNADNQYKKNEVLCQTTGAREWYFKRCAFSWSHTF